MTVQPGGLLRTLAQQRTELVADALRGSGVWLDVGAATFRVQSDSPCLPQQLQAAYAEFPFQNAGEWADVHLRIDRVAGLRRWVRPQVVLRCDGQVPFEPFAADSPLPLLEWGCNWMIGHWLNDLLLLHAGVVERDGMALILPAMPGSGKSTLTAALACRGWRLLSDEFGAFDPVAGMFMPLLKPVGLKNESIAVIKRFAPEARFGPDFPKTRKGTVAHMAPPRDAVRRRHEGARPGMVVLPRWEAGSATRWEPLAEPTLFSALAFNAFNYTLLGALGYEAVMQLTRSCRSWQLIYSDLEDALRTIDETWTEVVAGPGAPVA